MKNMKATLLIATGLLWSVTTHAGETLTIDETVLLALKHDISLKAYELEASSWADRSKAVDTLPDPKLKLAAINVPTDTWATDQTAMTQMQIGLRQKLPPFGSLDAKRDGHLARAKSSLAQHKNQERKLMRDVRTAWLELYYWQEADHIIEKNKGLFTQLQRITELQYAAGRSSQQHVLQASLEWGRLEDRQHKVRIRADQARAALARFIGETDAQRPLPETCASLPGVKILADIVDSLPQHPIITEMDAMLAGKKAEIDLARSGYKPSVTVDLTYGKRDGVYADGRPLENLASAMLLVDLPLFGGRQGKQVNAGESSYAAVQYRKDDMLRMLRQKAESANAAYRHLGMRVDNYTANLIPQAKANASAALRAYQSDRGQFTDLMRARVMELDTGLQHLRLQTDWVKAQAELLYFGSEDQ
ncbi:MAG: TolC family protein [Proteobacteria bacterium]|nr:TolC family protein [Pseudomonadota bacterium]